MGAVTGEAVAADERVGHWGWRCQQTTGREDGCLVWAETCELVRESYGERSRATKGVEACEQVRGRHSEVERATKDVEVRNERKRMNRWAAATTRSRLRRSVWTQRAEACELVCDCEGERLHATKCAEASASMSARGCTKLGVPSQRPVWVGASEQRRADGAETSEDKRADGGGTNIKTEV